MKTKWKVIVFVACLTGATTGYLAANPYYGNAGLLCGNPNNNNTNGRCQTACVKIFKDYSYQVQPNGYYLCANTDLDQTCENDATFTCYYYYYRSDNCRGAESNIQSFTTNSCK